jgi:hypothetical protein
VSMKKGRGCDGAARPVGGMGVFLGFAKVFGELVTYQPIRCRHVTTRQSYVGLVESSLGVRPESWFWISVH